jgi:SAM-dependent methyltransferase
MTLIDNPSHPPLSEQSSAIPKVLQGILRCPYCRFPLAELKCQHCGWLTQILDDQILICLDERHMSKNNAREMQENDKVLLGEICKPENYSDFEKKHYLAAIKRMSRLVQAISGYSPLSRLLFVAVGTGMEAFYADLPITNAVCTDISRQGLRGLVTRFNTRGRQLPSVLMVADAEDLPFEDNAFDIGIAFEGLHHCNVAMKGLSELVRCSRLGVVVFDNWDCQLQWWASRLGLGGNVEYSGLVANRFGRYELWAFAQNNRLIYQYFSIDLMIPTGLFNKLGRSTMAGNLFSMIGKPLTVFNQGNRVVFVALKQYRES